MGGAISWYPLNVWRKWLLFLFYRKIIKVITNPRTKYNKDKAGKKSDRDKKVNNRALKRNCWRGMRQATSGLTADDAGRGRRDKGGKKATCEPLPHSGEHNCPRRTKDKQGPTTQELENRGTKEPRARSRGKQRENMKPSPAQGDRRKKRRGWPNLHESRRENSVRSGGRHAPTRKRFSVS